MKQDQILIKPLEMCIDPEKNRRQLFENKQICAGKNENDRKRSSSESACLVSI